MKRVLIVNADDCNLTHGVTQAILDCHDRGIVTSTTFLVNLPVDSSTLHAVKKRKSLGVGIHLNITLDEPVSASSRVRSLLGEDGRFKKIKTLLLKPPKPKELWLEYENQIKRFKKIFNCMPTHLDTHHHHHDHPFFFEVFAEIARCHRLAVRRSHPFFQKKKREIRTTDYFFGNLSPEGYWRPETLRTILTYLPGEVSEIMCHPGRCDRDLESISSFTHGREAEWKLFASSELKRFVLKNGITLSHFGLCYTCTYENFTHQ